MSSLVSAASGRRQSGFSYVEILVAMSLIAVALVPAMNALRAGVSATTVQETQLTLHYTLTGRMEQVLAEPFAALSNAAGVAGDEKTPSSYSDTAGSNPRVLVYLSRYDMDNADADGNVFTGGDDGILWVRVAIEGTPLDLQTLTGSS
jgi:type II secretory pathway pseudopilin PulG